MELAAEFTLHGVPSDVVSIALPSQPCDLLVLAFPKGKLSGGSQR